MKTGVFLAGALIMCGCASQPDTIQATYVSPEQYGHFDCDQVRGEMLRISGRVNDLHGYLKEEADSDAAEMAVGLILLWPTLFWLDGDGVEAQEYARLKGEYQALEQVSVTKKCSLPGATEADEPVADTAT